MSLNDWRPETEPRGKHASEIYMSLTQRETGGGGEGGGAVDSLNDGT